MATVHIPALLRDLTGDAEQVLVEIPEGETLTVGEVVDELERRYPGFAGRLLEDGQLVPSIAVFIGEEQVRMGLLEKVRGKDSVFFLPPMVGGQ